MIAGLLALLLSGHASAQPDSCAALKTLLLPDVKITDAVAVAAAATGNVRAAHCRVDGIVGREIRFRLLLPSEWNHKFIMGGGGGYVAGIDNQASASVNDGYASVGTDTGHQGGLADATWGINNVERQLNFGHLAVHRVAEVAKAIIRQHYGAAASRSYFNGCSNGGRQALMEAQRYPEDFDGIIAGAPAYDFTGLAAQFVKDIGRVSHCGQPDDTRFSGGSIEEHRATSDREVRCDRRSDGRADGGSSPLHRRCVDADGPDRSAEEGTADHLR